MSTTPTRRPVTDDEFSKLTDDQLVSLGLKHAEHGAPADFGGTVYPNPDGIKPSFNTDPGEATRMPDGVTLSSPTFKGPAKMDTSNPPAAQILPKGNTVASTTTGTPIGLDAIKNAARGGAGGSWDEAPLDVTPGAGFLGQLKSHLTGKKSEDTTDSLGREVSSLGDSISSIPDSIAHGLVDPPQNKHEKDLVAGHNKVASQIALAGDRAVAEPLRTAASWYKQTAQGKVPDAYGQALSVAPEAVGIGASGPLTEKLLAAEHPTVAKQAMNEHAAFGGSTTDPRTGASLNGTKNWSVGVAPESTVVSDRQFQPQEFNDFASTHKDTLAQHQNSAIGTHYDPSTGLHHMEIVATTPSKAAAAGAAAHLGENSIFHLGTNESVPTGINPEADRPLSPLSIDDRFNAVRSATPAKAPFSGTHFSDSKLDTIDGTRRGTSGIGEENARLRLGSQTGMGKDAPAGFYVYQSGSLPEGQLAGRKNAHSVRGQMAFGTTDRPEFQNGYQEGVQNAISQGADPQTAHSLGLNHAEHALQEAGYDGYYNAQNPNTRFVFGSHTPEPSGAYQPPKGMDLDPDRTSGGTRSLKLGVEDPTFHKNVQGFPADQQTSGGSRKLNLGANTGFAKDLGASARQASESKFGPMRRSGDPVTNNASGESAASQEALNRTKSEASQGIKRFRIDSRSGIETPLFGPDAVDAVAGSHDVIVARGPHGETVVDQGNHVTKRR